MVAGAFVGGVAGYFFENLLVGPMFGAVAGLLADIPMLTSSPLTDPHLHNASGSGGFTGTGDGGGCREIGQV